ncbi:hypothetical protein BD770DRAFT_377672, partial [Pilaira anomala]
MYAKTFSPIKRFMVLFQVLAFCLFANRHFSFFGYIALSCNPNQVHIIVRRGGRNSDTHFTRNISRYDPFFFFSI